VPHGRACFAVRVKQLSHRASRSLLLQSTVFRRSAARSSRASLSPLRTLPPSLCAQAARMGPPRRDHFAAASASWLVFI